VKLAASDPVTGDIKLNYVKKILLYHFLWSQRPAAKKKCCRNVIQTKNGF
jgi:hypothetical protein